MKLENRIRYKCRIWISVVHWSQKTTFEPIKNKFSRSKFFGQKLRWKKFIWNWKIEFPKNIEYDSAWCANRKKLYLSPSKNQFLRWKFFCQKFGWKKFLWNWKIEFPTNAEYDSAWSADHDKLYLSPSKNQFLRTKFFGQKSKWKKFPWNWKIELAKKAEYDSAWSADREKLYLSPPKINFYDRNFLVRNWGEKNLFEIGKWNGLKMQNMTQRDPLITKNYIWAHQKINF